MCMIKQRRLVVKHYRFGESRGSEAWNRSLKEALVDPHQPSPTRGHTVEQEVIVGILMGDSTQLTGEQAHKPLKNGRSRAFADSS